MLTESAAWAERAGVRAAPRAGTGKPTGIFRPWIGAGRSRGGQGWSEQWGAARVPARSPAGSHPAAPGAGGMICRWSARCRLEKR